VGAAVNRRAEQVRDRAVGRVSGYPGSSPHGLELGNGRRLVRRDLGHADRGELATRVAVDPAQRLQRILSRKADPRQPSWLLRQHQHPDSVAAMAAEAHSAANRRSLGLSADPG
jgi:hypothetical protein